jgi:hypothetical protein
MVRWYSGNRVERSWMYDGVVGLPNVKHTPIQASSGARPNLKSHFLAQLG